MPLLFWLDIAGLTICTVITAALALMVLGSGRRGALSRSFTLFTIIEAAWAVCSLLLRMALLLNIGNPTLLLELTALAFVLMGPFLLMFTVRYVGRPARQADIAAALGLASLVLLSVPLFRHQIILNPRLDVNGSAVSDISGLGLVAALLPVLYMVWSLVLF